MNPKYFLRYATDFYKFPNKVNNIFVNFHLKLNQIGFHDTLFRLTRTVKFIIIFIANSLCHNLVFMIMNGVIYQHCSLRNHKLGCVIEA